MWKTDALGIDNLMRRFAFWYISRKGPSMKAHVIAGDRRVWARTRSSLATTAFLPSLTAHDYNTCLISGLDKLRIRQMLGVPTRLKSQ
ncbi:MAG: hypothetical protein GY720_16000 [bacterium]|nr:hypothetical protein [bacterium]MCP5032529.1 hypothetical protein [Actinomycetes bacterium]